MFLTGALLVDAAKRLQELRSAPAAGFDRAPVQSAAPALAPSFEPPLTSHAEASGVQSPSDNPAVSPLNSVQTSMAKDDLAHAEFAVGGPGMPALMAPALRQMLCQYMQINLWKSTLL